MATGSAPTAHTQRMIRTSRSPAAPSAQATSCGASRCDTCLAWQLISPPIGSSWVLRPPIPSTGIRYSAGLARYSCPSGSLRINDRRASSPMATSISAMLTLYRRASALRLGSCQPGSRCTSAAAIRSASTPLAPR